MIPSDKRSCAEQHTINHDIFIQRNFFGRRAAFGDIRGLNAYSFYLPNRYNDMPTNPNEAQSLVVMFPFYLAIGKLGVVNTKVNIPPIKIRHDREMFMDMDMDDLTNMSSTSWHIIKEGSTANENMYNFMQIYCR